MIEIPEVWSKFGLYIYQDFFSEHPDFQEGISFALEGLSYSDKLGLASFIGQVLSENPSNQDLIDLWAESGASDILVSDQMNPVYKVMLDIVEARVKNGCGSQPT
ncbi:hypothetical protein [Marinagarivorans algicola]|uniref:hypothetical protein n=1 Tax=Marinagarivorans algicola TaxID=1513270 RepID=UPI0006B8F335|nr:hypothetical protein [Marinagarivorans algicola]